MTKVSGTDTSILEYPAEEQEPRQKTAALKTVWIVIKKTPNSIEVEAVLGSKKDLKAYGLTPENEYMDRDRNQYGRWAVQVPVTH